MAQRSALVTGALGQDGVLLSRHLARGGVRVIGTMRAGEAAAARIQAYLSGVELVEHDVRDTAAFATLLERFRPREVYNLAGFSSVAGSWNDAELVEEVNGAAVERMLATLVTYRHRHGIDVRFFQASSAQEFADASDSPYARSKLRARAAVERARSAHGLFACAAVLHSHESPLRGPQFVTRKITRGAAAISAGTADGISLGNLAVSRDWGAARDYVRAFPLMLAADEPRDLVIASGEPHPLRDVLAFAFSAVGLADPMRFVTQDPALLRKTDAAFLPADVSETERVLDWRATTSLQDLIEWMVEVDLRRLRSGIEDSPDYLDDAE